ncbi:cyclophilin-like family protein [uncultured Kordia sp.]|uniref:cyclophilin-like family protein n=1 Tax=uncultured Kordia sp. TaxID=507699 RepID=UPI002605459A|nr:cyclophilin-like family protein [uncultured Kordia sp.]
MQPILHTKTAKLEIIWDESCGIINQIKESNSLEGIATHIQGEVFFYQYELDIPFDGSEREVFEIGDVVYWRSQTDNTKFGILFMYGNTTYGDGTKPRTSSPGIKIGKMLHHDAIQLIQTGEKLILG